MGDTARLAELRRRVEFDPASIAFATLAEEYRRAGRFDEAVEASRGGLRFHPSYVSARVTLGRSLVELGEHEQAERELQLVLKASPDNLAARRALGDLYWRQSDLTRALEQFRSAVALAPGDHELADVVHALEREVEAAGPAAPPSGATAEAGMAPASASAAPRAQPSGPVLAALERFYRAIVRARGTGSAGTRRH